MNIVNITYSQRYLNEKDKLFGVFTWRQFVTKLMGPMLISGLVTNLLNGGLGMLIIVFFIFFISSLLLEVIFSKEFLEYLIIKIIKPKSIILPLEYFLEAL